MQWPRCSENWPYMFLLMTGPASSAWTVTCAAGSAAGNAGEATRARIAAPLSSVGFMGSVLREWDGETNVSLHSAVSRTSPTGVLTGTGKTGFQDAKGT